MSDGATTMRAWRMHEWGQPLDVLQLDVVPVPEPGPGELLVRVQGIPLNLNDLERINGGNMMVIPELPCCPGMEVMGTVEACGPGAEEWQGSASWRRPRARPAATPSRRSARRPPSSSCPTTSRSPTPAALYFPFHLAWLGLFDRAELQGGESVLIHAAAGGAGSAAVQLAVDAGATVFATAGTDGKVLLCRELGAEFAINYRETDFAEVVMAETGNRGVDVVFDNVGASVFDQSLKCTAYNGRYLMMGFASDKTKVDEPFIVPRRIAAGNLKLCGVLLSYAPPEIGAFVKQAMGFNFPTRDLGQQITDSIVELVRDEARTPRDRPGRELRGDPRGDHRDGQPRDDRPRDHHGLKCGGEVCPVGRAGPAKGEPMAELPLGTVTFLFTDLEGSTRFAAITRILAEG